MKQFTTPKQTAKLIELGFDEPKSETEETLLTDNCYRLAYSIGELIEMLPKKLDTTEDEEAYLGIEWDNIGWRLDYARFGFYLYTSMNLELIDVLYEMVIKLKEEGVI